MNRKLLFTATLAALALTSTAANALTFGAPIGIDFDGGANSFIYADLWTERTDTGVDINPRGNGTTFVAGDVHTFQSQHRVGTFQNDGNPVFAPLDPQAPGSPNYELTQLTVFNDQVVDFTPNGTGGGLVEFTHLPDALTNMYVYLDRLDTDVGTASQASPGSGAGTVNCYGAGPLGGASCPKNPNDGILIMTWDLISNTSSFNATSFGTGTGSYDLQFALTYYNPSYVDVSQLNGANARLRFTGTLSQPLGGGTPQPAQMWNGVVGSTATSSPNQLFKIDGSKEFAAGVPEPGTLALLGLGLFGLSRMRRRQA
jgi:hypothetical protein